jgi:hypothetical protein
MEIAQKLIELEQILIGFKPSPIDYLQNGIEENEIRESFNSINFTKLPDDLIDFYKWKNGTCFKDIPTGKLNFGINGVFISLNDCLDMYVHNLSENLYTATFFPIFSDDTHLINLDKNSSSFGGIFIYSPSLLINEPTLCFDSLYTMIETLLVCFQSKIFWYEDGIFEYDVIEAWNISAKLNPKSEYWVS